MDISIENHVLHSRYGDRKALELLKEAGFNRVDYSFYWMEPELDEMVLGDLMPERFVPGWMNWG